MPPAASGSKGSKKKGAAAVAAAPAPAAAAQPEPVAAPAPVLPAETQQEAPVTPAPKKKGAAAKKPVKVVAVVTPDGIEGSFQPEPRRPLIAQLHIRPNEVVFHDQPLRYDPNPPAVVDPAPYDATEVNFFLGGQESIGLGAAAAVAAATTKSVAEEEADLTAVPPAVAAVAPAAPSTQAIKGAPCFKKWDLMVQFRGASQEKKLPESTEIACFWCAHSFEGMPYVIPEREVGGVYNVYGNFCCPECAVAYLLQETLDPHVRWERMALLHRIYDPAGYGRIFPAPARESLSLFGGPMSIEVFRQTAAEKRVRVDLHMPPMVSILGSIDTKPIDFFDTSNKSNLPISAPVRSVEEGLRLKRSKPLKERESTLDSVMNIKIGGARRGGGLGAGT